MRSAFNYLATFALLIGTVASAQDETCSGAACAAPEGVTLRSLEGATPSEVVEFYYQDLKEAASLWSLMPYVPFNPADEDAYIADFATMPDEQKEFFLTDTRERYLLADPQVLAEAVVDDRAVVTVRGRKAGDTESEPIWVTVTMERLGNQWKVSQPREGHFTGAGAAGFGHIADHSLESAVTRLINSAAGIKPVVDVRSSVEVGGEAMVVVRITPINAEGEDDFFITALNLLRVDGEWTVAGTHDY